MKKDSPFRLEIKENRKSFKTAQLLENVVNHRFHQTEGVKHNGMATAKTDSFLELRVPKVYKHNQNRYFRVIKLLPLVANPQLSQVRMATWGEELLDPTKAGIAALRLEGLGVTAVETLKRGLANPNAQVQFFAAEALAYLNDASGADVLGDTAIKNLEFRPFALAALAATDQPASRMKLVKLMEVPEIPVRYGAFNALRTLDESDPFLGRVRVLEDPKDDDDDDDDDSESMSMAIAKSPASRRPHQPEPFALYVVDSDGPPLVHLARTKRCEVVVFGRGQRLLTPIVLGNGSILLNAADGDRSLQISKIGSGREGDEDAKVHASLDIDDVIRQTAGLGAKYPDVVAILRAAASQKNLPGPLVVDAVPVPTSDYLQAAILGKDTTKKDDEVSKTSAEVPRRRFFGLFGRPAKKESKKEKEADSAKEQADNTKPAAPKGDEPKPDAPKTDDAIDKSSLETSEKPSFFDRLRRR